MRASAGLRQFANGGPRSFEPRHGRFLQVDPIGYDDQINLYAYVANDPVGKTDPDGRCGISVMWPGSACNRAYAAAVDFLTGDFVNAYKNPTVATISIAVVQVLPAAKLGKAAAVTFKLGSAAATKLAGRELSKAFSATVNAMNKGGGRTIVEAGSGSLQQAERLANQYGGKVSDYEKITSGVIARGSDGTKVQVHAFRNVETGAVIEPKLKVFPGAN